MFYALSFSPCQKQIYTFSPLLVLHPAWVKQGGTKCCQTFLFCMSSCSNRANPNISLCRENKTNWGEFYAPFIDATCTINHKNKNLSSFTTISCHLLLCFLLVRTLKWRPLSNSASTLCDICQFEVVRLLFYMETSYLASKHKIQQNSQEEKHFGTAKSSILYMCAWWKFSNPLKKFGDCWDKE